jgi:uncharacterized protein (TIGR02466 family)
MHDQLLDATPWAPLIYKIHYSGDLTNIVQKVRAEHVMTQPNIGVMAGGGKTSVLNQGKAPHGWQEMKPILNWFTPHMKEIWKQWELQSDIELNIFKSWTNITKSSGYVEEHDHGGCHFAVSMYLEKPEGSGDIQFRNMNLSLNANTPKDGKANGINDYFTEVKAVTGDALVFPGWLPHRVPANPTDKERIVFSFNVHGVSPGSPIVIGDKG